MESNTQWVWQIQWEVSYTPFTDWQAVRATFLMARTTGEALQFANARRPNTTDTHYRVRGIARVGRWEQEV